MTADPTWKGMPLDAETALALLEWQREMGVDEIAAKIGCCLVMTGQILAAFRRSGQVVRVERRRYAPASDTGRAGGA